MKHYEYAQLDSDPLLREYNALTKQLDAKMPTDPNEIWELVQQLMDAGWGGHADRLAMYLPDLSDD